MNHSATHSTALDNSPFQSQVSPRLRNRKLNIIRHAVDIVQTQTGYITNKAVADYLGVSIEEYKHILQDVNIYHFFNLKQEVA